MRIGMLMPVGPDEADVRACRDTLRSIAAWEPAVATVALIDDGPPRRDLVAEVGAHDFQVVSLRHPLAGTDAPRSARMGAGVLFGLGWLTAETRATVMMKLDTDALVIAPFADKLASALADPRVGLVGSYDRTCNGEPRSFAPWIAHLQAATRVIRPRPSRHIALGRRARRVRRLIREAQAAGYQWGEHVLACALAMPRPAAEACVAAAGDPLTFAGTDIGDDPILGVLVRRAGYRLAGHVGEGETFGVAWRGLPDTPEGLLRRGYSIIHSVKNDPRFAEGDIRRYFAAARPRSRRASPPAPMPPPAPADQSAPAGGARTARPSPPAGPD